MVSWQTRALEAYLVIKRLLSDRSGNLDVAKERADVESMAKMFKPLGPIQCEPVAANGVPAEWICPVGATPARTVLFLHGGSFNSGSIVSHRTLAGNVALAADARSLLIDYRLAPEHPFPAAIEDALAAYQWLLAQGIAPRQIVVAGDSAGGSLVLALLVQLRDQRQPLPGRRCLPLPCAGPDLLQRVVDLQCPEGPDARRTQGAQVRRDLPEGRRSTRAARLAFLRRPERPAAAADPGRFA